MKKKTFIIVIAFLVLSIIAGVIAVAYFQGFFYKANGQQKKLMNYINSSNSIIWYYGNLDPGEEVKINYKKVDRFTEKTIGDENNQYKYHAIVIFDFDGSMNITNNELLLIKDYCENKYYDMLYYGTAHIEQFRACGYFDALDNDDCGFIYNGSFWKNRTKSDNYLNPYLLTGNWTLEDNENYNTKDRHKMWKFVIQYVSSLIEDAKGEKNNDMTDGMSAFNG